jgi:hypothetical protein
LNQRASAALSPAAPLRLEPLMASEPAASSSFRDALEVEHALASSSAAQRGLRRFMDRSA